jgi:signal transduction histidine kinase
LTPLLRWLLPAGFRGQVAGILLLGLALSQVMAAILYMVLVPQWQRVLRPELAVTKVAMVVQLLESVPESDRARFAGIWNGPDFQVAYESGAREFSASSGASDAGLTMQTAGKLAKSLDQVHVGGAATREQPDLKRIQVLLHDGGRVEVITPVGLEHRIGLLEQLAIVAFLVFATGGLWAWLTWSVNTPLDRFSRAAERVGLDVNAPRLPEEGPLQLKRATRAFNEMQIRLQRFLSDRTRMLGAISHDLRTPLTRLRLRIETDRIEADKPKMLADIETMEAMLTSTLAFIRGAEEIEALDVVDLDSLLQTVCDLVADVGAEVGYEGPPRCRYTCKPQAMLRALTNVVSNAAKYGERARVTLERTQGGYLIEVADDGPGIPDSEKEKVFEPFYRTAAALESDREGMGLGLAIARSIILAHGGVIELNDREPHGLTVRILLPESSSANTGQSLV